MATGAVVAGVGTLIALEAQNREDKEVQRAARENGKLLEFKAKERLSRSVINRKVIGQEGQEFAASQLVELAGSGVDISEGTSLSILEDTKSEILRQQNMEKQLAEFEAEAIRRSADEVARAAKSHKDAAGFRTAATIFRGVSTGMGNG